MRIRDLQVLSGLMAVLSGACLTMAWHVGMEPYPGIANREIATWQPAESVERSGYFGQEGQPALSEALSRPLFRQSRRPFEPVREAVAEAVPAPTPFAPSALADASQISVRGILIEGQSRQALIVTPEAPDGVWMAMGSDVLGWKITGLDPGGVILEAGQQHAELKLYVDNSAN